MFGSFAPEVLSVLKAGCRVCVFVVDAVDVEAVVTGGRAFFVVSDGRSAWFVLSEIKSGTLFAVFVFTGVGVSASFLFCTFGALESVNCFVTLGADGIVVGWGFQHVGIVWYCLRGRSWGKWA